MQISSLLASVIHPVNPAMTNPQPSVDNQTSFLARLQEEHIAQLEQEQQILTATEAASHNSLESVEVPVMPEVHEKVIIRGCAWDDKFFANSIDHFSHRVSTEEKTINWHATGTDVLTKAQEAELRERYDVQNLSEQDFYDLIADLTNLNVVSAEDCTRLFVKDFPVEGALLTPSNLDEGYERVRFRDGWCNFLKFFDRELKYAQKFLEWLGSKSYTDYNPNKPVMQRNLTEATNREIVTFQKFLNIFQSIARQE